MSDTPDYADQWISVADLLDLSDRLKKEVDLSVYAHFDTLITVITWMADQQMLSYPGGNVAPVQVHVVEGREDALSTAAGRSARFAEKMATAARDVHLAQKEAKENPPEASVGPSPAEGIAGIEGNAEDPAPAPAPADPSPTGRWSKAEIDRARQMLAEGFTASAIAAKLGRPLPATRKKLSALGGKSRATGKRKIPAGPRAAPQAARDQGPEGAGTTPPRTAVTAPETGQQEGPAPAVLPAAVAGAAGSDTPARAVKQAGLQQVVPGATSRPLWWREIEAELNAIGYKGGWSARDDLDLVEGLARGVDRAILADQLGKEANALKARFIQLTPEGVTIEGQTRLLQVLRARAAAA